MISVFELFNAAIGPSSSHTVGPMRAAHAFASALQTGGQLPSTAHLVVDLFGSLALTGMGHGTDRAVLLGLEGECPELVDVSTIDRRVAAMRAAKRVAIAGVQPLAFDEATDLVFHRGERLPEHPNGMRFTAFDVAGAVVLQREWYSVGGGFIAAPGEVGRRATTTVVVPYDFHSARSLMAYAATGGLSVAQVVEANERALNPARDVRAGLLELWAVMTACVNRGLKATGELPGGLHVKRRAASLVRKLQKASTPDPLQILDWVSVWAMAVNEENAAGGRVVTAPTNGASGLIPAVLHYYTRFVNGATDEGVCAFLLTAAAVGILCKENASISGAEIGCQGEVGVACGMAAAGLVAALRGTNAQMEHAAEIGIEHHLGLTCDPVGGLVQIPCIERNAVGAVKAIHAARLSMQEDADHKVSLDQVIETMRQTGRDMQASYKETSLAGLAVNVINC